MSAGFTALPPQLKVLTWGYYGVRDTPLSVSDLIEAHEDIRHRELKINFAYRQIAHLLTADLTLADPRAEQMLPEREYAVNHQTIRDRVQRIAHTTFVWSPILSPGASLDLRLPSYRELNLANRMKNCHLEPMLVNSYTSQLPSHVENKPSIVTILDLFVRAHLFDEGPFRNNADGRAIDPQEAARVLLRYENGIISACEVNEANKDSSGKTLTPS